MDGSNQIPHREAASRATDNLNTAGVDWSSAMATLNYLSTETWAQAFRQINKIT